MLINGRPGESVSALDRGLHYGDGLFETLAVVSGEPALWKRHMRRLESGCRRLAIPLPDLDLLASECRRLIGTRQLGVLKILLTRGAGGRGYRAPAEPEPTRIVAFHSWPGYPRIWWREGIRLRVCSTRLGDSLALVGLKHLNRLEQVLARAEWEDPEIAEGVMLDSAGHPVEGTMTNLFLMRKGALFTPDLNRCGVSGVMREVVMEVARERGMAVSEATLELQDLEEADALLVTNSLIGIWPVRELQRRCFDPAVIPASFREAVDRAAGLAGEVGEER